MATATPVGLGLEPLDVLFFRDGRPFLSGTEQMTSGLPLPQTVAGAIRTALLRTAGCDFRRLKQAIEAGQSFAQAVTQACHQQYHGIGQIMVRGPWLARWLDKRKEQYEVLVPAPAILHKRKGKGENKEPEGEKEKKEGQKSLFRLTPLPAEKLPGWSLSLPEDQQGLRPLWLRELVVTELEERYLTRAGLEQFLRGEDVDVEAVVPASKLYEFDYRTGIGIHPDRLAAAESQIYGRGFLALADNVFLYAEVMLPAEDSVLGLFRAMTTLALGGESKQVRVHCLPQPFAWPNQQPQGDKQKPLVLLTTPCPFQAGWKPQALNGRLVAAAVPGSLAFSGWDLARGGPKPTRFAVPAGSVYFLESLPDNWQHSLAENDEDRQLGWGCCLTGVWNP
ncbi:MAG TPA: type III-B CRISPR module-associated protein Cmr3 [Gemmataceae bacterium]|nr:type III-B CRISPR module-associated protein Cmr3 [Gemmataceae bacterium]